MFFLLSLPSPTSNSSSSSRRVRYPSRALPLSIGWSSNLGHKSYTAAPITVKNERTGKPFPVMEKSAKIIQYGLEGGEKKTFRFDLGLSFDRGDFGRMIVSGSTGDGAVPQRRWSTILSIFSSRYR